MGVSGFFFFFFFFFFWGGGGGCQGGCERERKIEVIVKIPKKIRNGEVKFLRKFKNKNIRGAWWGSSRGGGGGRVGVFRVDVKEELKFL